MAHNGGSNGNEPFGPGPAPAHTGATKTGLKLLGLTFNHARANGVTLFSNFKILHASVVGPKVVSLSAQVFVTLGLTGGGLSQAGSNLVSLALEQTRLMLRTCFLNK